MLTRSIIGLKFTITFLTPTAFFNVKSTSRGNNDPDIIEHTGFLLYFLNKFMFYSNAQKIFKDIIIYIKFGRGRPKGVYGPSYGWSDIYELKPYG